MVDPKDLKPLFKKIYNLALPLYKQGREDDEAHHLFVAYTMTKLLEEYRLDEEIMMAAALLHDIGYARISEEKRRTHWLKEVRVDHMRYGAQMAEEILKKVNFPKNKIKQLTDIIAVHDNPEIGEILDSKEAKTLKEADVLWTTTERAFWLDLKRHTELKPEDWLETLKERFSNKYASYLTSSFSKKQTEQFIKKMEGQLKFKNN